MSTAKALVRALALAAAAPFVAGFHAHALLFGKDRALESFSQLLSLLPGLSGSFLRIAFLRCVLAECAPTAVVEFGTIFSKTAARILDRAYVGPFCCIGLAIIENDVIVGPGVQIPSGRHTHGISDARKSPRDQVGVLKVVRIGAGSWIGTGAVVMDDIGPNTVVGAGAVVSKALPGDTIVAGVPARVIRSRSGES